MMLSCDVIPRYLECVYLSKYYYFSFVKMYEVETSLQGFVKFIFIENTSDAKVYMNLPQGDQGIRDNHDLFVFCTDLLCKGLVLLYGNEENRVPIDSLTSEQLQYVKTKLLNAGIDLKVDIKQIVSMVSESPNVKPCIVKGDGEDLSSYKLRLVSKNFEYTIQFDLVRI